MSTTISPKAWPLAPDSLTTAILELVKKAQNSKQLRKGANEVTKSLNRSKAEIVIIAADTDPIEIVMHLPLLCEDKNVPYVYIPSRAALGRACSIPRSAIAVSIVQNNKGRDSFQKEIENMKNKIEQLFTNGQ